MEIINDIIDVNKKTFKKTINSLRTGWPIIFTGIVYTVLNAIIFGLVFTLFKGPLSIIAGLIAAVISAAMISNYLYLLFNVVNYNRLTFQDFKDGFTAFTRKIYSVFFYGWIASILLDFIGSAAGSGIKLFNSLITIAILIAFNPLPETIYLKSYDGLESIKYSAEFMRENILNWALANIVLQLIMYLISGNVIVDLFTTNISMSYYFGPSNILIHLIGQFLFSFIMIYRGHLFKLLSTSTRRKRMFMSKF